MYVIAGATGHVGGAAAEALLAQGQKIRVIVRDEAKGLIWSRRGAEVVLGDLADQQFLDLVLHGTHGAFFLLPPDFASVNILEDQKKLGNSIAEVVKELHLPHVVMLSSIGADLSEGTGPIKGLHYFENALRATGTPVTAIRAGYFMENIAQAIGAAKSAGIYPNMMPSQDIPTPMVATKDIGRLVAATLLSGLKNEIVDISGPAYTVKELAQKVGRALKKDLQIVDIPQEGWMDALTNAGVPHPWAEQYVEMYQGFLSGRITPKGDRMVQGKTEIDEVIASLLNQ